jgi:hypothetical protein
LQQVLGGGGGKRRGKHFSQQPTTILPKFILLNFYIALELKLHATFFMMHGNIASELIGDQVPSCVLESVRKALL